MKVPLGMAGQSAGNGFADAATAAGNDGAPAFELLAHAGLPIEAVWITGRRAYPQQECKLHAMGKAPSGHEAPENGCVEVSSLRINQLPTPPEVRRYQVGPRGLNTPSSSGVHCAINPVSHAR